MNYLYKECPEVAELISNPENNVQNMKTLKGLKVNKLTEEIYRKVNYAYNMLYPK